jgi:hypothetical protein
LSGILFSHEASLKGIGCSPILHEIVDLITPQGQKKTAPMAVMKCLLRQITRWITARAMAASNSSQIENGCMAILNLTDSQ